MIKICQICGKEFDCWGMTSKFCSSCKNDKNKKYLDNPEIKGKKRMYAKKYYSINIEKIKAYRNKPEIKEKCRISDKRYYDKNRQKIIKKVGAYHEYKRSISDEYKVLTNLRCRLWNILFNTKLSGIRVKENEFIGCSKLELKTHLESKFKDGMMWSNYGICGWHIDHIKPCSKFEFNNIEDIKNCFHYTNLQPLWAIDNIRKGNK
jgi:hypothetical protein